MFNFIKSLKRIFTNFIQFSTFFKNIIMDHMEVILIIRIIMKWLNMFKCVTHSRPIPTSYRSSKSHLISILAKGFIRVTSVCLITCSSIHGFSFRLLIIGTLNPNMFKARALTTLDA